MKTTSNTINHSERLAILKAAKTEQMGLNAALKYLREAKGFKKLCTADALNPELFKSGANYIDFIKSHIPAAFNSDGALCRFVKDKDNPEVINLVPRTTYTPYAVYTLARKAARELNKSNK